MRSQVSVMNEGSGGTMRSWALCAVLFFWGTLSVSELHSHRVGRCAVITGTASFNCSQRKLAHIPSEIWDNATTLDLSQNQLNLTNPQHLRQLHRLDRLVTLNLSGNYLPLLEKKHLRSLPLLQILDLSNCHLTLIEAGALQGLPRLTKLFLGDNRLEGPLSVFAKMLPFLDLRGNKNIDSASDWPTGIRSQFQRKLLTKDLGELSPYKNNTNSSQGGNPGAGSKSWQYLVAVLVAAISLSLLITGLAKCQLVRRYLASYRHTRLTEGDAASQSEPSGLEVGYSMNRHGGYGRSTHPTAVHQGHMNVDDEEDDDGFIEDNYIQASERERAKRALELEEEEEDEMVFSIG
ncbi:hypothetical protein DPEC_G00338220 [Dallia pectoralis]|uniref:Uncharacterized protein n=1 Tax=Dallia pectoralis TaxID=75939 RepID=A0ACC2F4H9_DALPE|nr:hypothetical protein DPEC_G00338220 [Dallia pectoralis]